MRKICVVVMLIITHHCVGQCPFAVQLMNNGNSCLATDTLAISSSHVISKITWLNNNVPDTTLSAEITIKPPQNAITIAGGNGAGSRTNQFNSPASVFIDKDGYTYVADRSNYRILKFPPASLSATNGEIVAGGNGAGKGNNQFQPNCVFVDNDGFMYVADYINNRILKFPPGSTSTTDGVVIAGGNGAGSAANQLANAVSVFVDDNNYVYVVDAFNDRVQKFPPNSTSATNAVTVAGGNSYGSKANQLNGPSSVFVDKAGNIYVDDAANNRIQKFPFNSTSSTDGVTIGGGNGFGSAPNQLATPSSIWGDSDGNIFVADINNERIQKFASGSSSNTFGKTVAGGNGQGNTADRFSGPNAVWGDNKGNLYVSDVGNNRIQKFLTSDTKQYTIDTTFFPIIPGIYTAIVTDTLGCKVTTEQVTINPLLQPAVTISSSSPNIISCSQNEAELNFIATSVNGGTSPLYQWQINGKNVGLNSSYLHTVVLNHDSVRCLLMSNAACASPTIVISNNIAIRLPSKPISYLSTKGRLCVGDDTLVISADNVLSEISWYRGSILDTVVQAQERGGNIVLNSTFMPSVAGSYRAVVKDTTGCVDTSNTITIHESIKPHIDIVSDKNKICEGSPISFTATSLHAGNNPAYEWQVKGVKTATDSRYYTRSFSEYNDSVRCIVYGDTTGCFSNDTSNSIIPNIKPVPVFTHVSDKKIAPGKTIILSIPVTGNIISYSWLPVTGLSNPFVANPTASPAATSNYILRVLSADSCVAADSIKVIVSFPIIIPTAFTPNGDGLNDKWYVLGGDSETKIQTLLVFNRQGQKVYSAIDIPAGLSEFGWDGTFNGNPQPLGQYVYEAIIISAQKKKTVLKGTLVLIR